MSQHMGIYPHKILKMGTPKLINVLVLQLNSLVFPCSNQCSRYEGVEEIVLG